jgi:hypothetical protein
MPPSGFFQRQPPPTGVCSRLSRSSELVRAAGPLEREPLGDDWCDAMCEQSEQDAEVGAEPFGVAIGELGDLVKRSIRSAHHDSDPVSPSRLDHAGAPSGTRPS